MYILSKISQTITKENFSFTPKEFDSDRVMTIK